jgi:phosphoglycolate phosphatase-like HAD superfamily hydrolase
MGELPQRIKAIALDFDGTLADSMPGQELAWRHAARVAKLSPELENGLVENLYAGKAGIGMFDKLGLEVLVQKSLRMAKDDRWFSVRNQTPLFPDAAATVRGLATRYRLAIATTADRVYVETILSREIISKCFELIVTDSDVQNPKPAPDMIHAIAAHTQTRVSEICLIGDSVADFDLSVRSGCAFIWFGAERKSRCGNGTMSTSSWIEIARWFGV